MEQSTERSAGTQAMKAASRPCRGGFLWQVLQECDDQHWSTFSYSGLRYCWDSWSSSLVGGRFTKGVGELKFRQKTLLHLERVVAILLRSDALSMRWLLWVQIWWWK